MQKFKKIIFIVVVLGIIGGAIAAWQMGYIDLRDAETKARQTYFEGRGAVQRSLATPQGDPESARQCRENLKRIESAKRQVAAERGIVTGGVSRDAVIAKMGGTIPRCPLGGEYNINEVGRMPTCSVGKGSAPGQEDDHVILSF